MEFWDKAGPPQKKKVHEQLAPLPECTASNPPSQHSSQDRIALAGSLHQCPSLNRAPRSHTAPRNRGHEFESHLLCSQYTPELQVNMNITSLPWGPSSGIKKKNHSPILPGTFSLAALRLDICSQLCSSFWGQPIFTVTFDFQGLKGTFRNFLRMSLS